MLFRQSLIFCLVSRRRYCFYKSCAKHLHFLVAPFIWALNNQRCRICRWSYFTWEATKDRT